MARRPNDGRRARSLRYLVSAEESGGGVMWVHRLAELPAAMEKLSLQIRNEYVLGYFSGAPNDGRYHRVRIEVQPPDGSKVRASWRRGYVEP